MEQQAQPADAGVGLVEAIVGMLIAAVAIAALAQTLVISVRTQKTDNLQATANGLAVAELELMQALPWSAVGHYANDPGYQSGTLSLGATRPAGSRAPLPLSTGVQRGSGTYQVRRAVSLYDDPTTGAPTDYKQLSVVVSWTTGQGPRSTTVSSLRTPKVGELAPSDFALRRGAVDPVDVALTSAGALVSPLTLRVELTSPGTSASGSWTDRGGVVRTQALSTADAGRTFTAALPAGTCCFRSAETPFVLRASRTTPASAVSGTASAALLQTLSVDGVSASPASQCVPASGSPADVSMTVATTGTQATDSVVVTSSDGTTWTALPTAQSVSGGSWTVTVPGAAVGPTTTFRATAVRPRPTTTTAQSSVLGPLLSGAPC